MGTIFLLSWMAILCNSVKVVTLPELKIEKGIELFFLCDEPDASLDSGCKEEGLKYELFILPTSLQCEIPREIDRTLTVASRNMCGKETVPFLALPKQAMKTLSQGLMKPRGFL